MTKLDPRVDFAGLSDTNIARIGLDAAKEAFDYDVRGGLTNSDSLFLVVGVLDDEGAWSKLGHRSIGPHAAEFEKNVDPWDGKLGTALEYATDSVKAYQEHGDQIPKGPQRFVGAVWHEARVQTVEHDWMTRVYVGAASGVQGHFDAATTYSALTRMGACWALKMQALHGKP